MEINEAVAVKARAVAERLALAADEYYVPRRWADAAAAVAAALGCPPDVGGWWEATRSWPGYAPEDALHELAVCEATRTLRRWVNRVGVIPTYEEARAAGLRPYVMVLELAAASGRPVDWADVIESAGFVDAAERMRAAAVR